MKGHRASVYVRVSSAAQDGEDRVSLGEQEEACLAYCNERGYDVIRVYSEVGTGTSRRRPQFQAMLSEARAGRFDVLVTWKLDRLSRGVLPVGDLMAAVQPYGVGVEAVRDVVDMKYLALLASVAQLELDTLRERTTMGKRGAAKAGRIPAKSLPYGYRTEADGRPEVDEYRAGVVRRIYSLAVEEGLGTYRIADVLNAEGVPTPGGGPRWWAGTVQPILANETYCGVWFFGQRRVRTVEGGRKVSRTDRAEQIPVSVPVIVDRRMWERAQRLKQARRRYSGGSRRHSYLLSRLLRCGACGNGLHGLAREGGRRRYYRCSSSKYGLRCHEHPYIRADKLERVVWGEVSEHLSDPDSFVDSLLAMNDADSAAALEEEIARTERDLRKVTNEEDKLIRLFAVGKLTEEQLDRQRRFTVERREAAEERLAGLRAQAQAIQDRDIGLDSVKEWIGNISGRLADLDDAGRREVLRLVLEDVTIGDDAVRLNFALPVEPVVSVATSTPRSAWRSGPTAAYGLPM